MSRQKSLLTLLVFAAVFAGAQSASAAFKVDLIKPWGLCYGSVTENFDRPPTNAPVKVGVTSDDDVNIDIFTIQAVSGTFTHTPGWVVTIEEISDNPNHHSVTVMFTQGNQVLDWSAPGAGTVSYDISDPLFHDTAMVDLSTLQGAQLKLTAAAICQEGPLVTNDGNTGFSLQWSNEFRIALTQPLPGSKGPQ